MSIGAVVVTLAALVLLSLAGGMWWISEGLTHPGGEL